MSILKIELSDSDCDLHPDGLPRLVMVTLHIEGGQVKRFPWMAEKSISDLFAALGNIGPVRAESPEPVRSVKDVIQQPENDGTIGKGDIVRCVKIVPSNLGPAKQGSQFLQIGEEYTVQEVLGQNGQVTGYEIAGNGDFQIRTHALPEEIILVSKRAKGKGRVNNEMSAIRKCPACNEEVAVPKTGEEYKGSCSCGAILMIGRHAPTDQERKLWQKENKGKPCPDFLNDYAEVIS